MRTCFALFAIATVLVGSTGCSHYYGRRRYAPTYYGYGQASYAQPTVVYAQPQAVYVQPQPVYVQQPQATVVVQPGY